MLNQSSNIFKAGSLLLKILQVYHLKPWQRPHIKTQVCWVGMVLSEKCILKKYGCSGSKIPPEKVDSDGYLMPSEHCWSRFWFTEQLCL
jgi:hypothetical protein